MKVFKDSLMDKPDSLIKQALKEVQKIKLKMEEEAYINPEVAEEEIKKQMNNINQENSQKY